MRFHPLGLSVSWIVGFLNLREVDRELELNWFVLIGDAGNPSDSHNLGWLR